MTNKMIKEMIREINSNIELYYDFASEGESRQRARSKIFWKITGMIEMLEMLTGENYEWDKNGVYVK